MSFQCCGPYVQPSGLGTGAGGGGVAISAGTQLATSGTVVFSNSNGISFGMAGSSQITATFAAIKSFIAGTVTSNGPTISFANGNGVSFTANGNTISASVGVTARGALSAGTASVALGTAVFSNSNGVSFGLTGSTVTASVGVTAQGGLSAGTASVALGTAVFSNSNGISFGLNGSTVTASYLSNAIRAIVAGTASATGSTVSFANGSGVSFGVNGNTVTASVAAVSAISAIAAGTQTATSGTIQFSNANGISFGMAGSATITAQSGFTMPDFQNLPGPGGLANVTCAASISERPFFVPFLLPASISLDRLSFIMDMAGGASSVSFSVTAAIYTMVNSTQMSLLGSFSNSFQATNTASATGVRMYRMTGTGIPAAISALTPGPYVLGMHFHTLGGTASLNMSIRGASTGAVTGILDAGADQEITATNAITAFGSQFMGQYSTTTAALPNAIANADLFHGLTGGTQGPVHMWFRMERTA